MKVILFGATGMVGQGVLRECVVDPDVTAALSIGLAMIGVARRGYPKPILEAEDINRV